MSGAYTFQLAVPDVYLVLQFALSHSVASQFFMKAVEQLAPRIRQILTAPDTDLSTVSAKHVRRHLLELDPDITLEYIKEHKEAIDALIGRIFELLNNPNGSDVVGDDPEYAVNGNGKRKREDEGDEQDEDEDEEDREQQEEPPAPRTPKKQKKGKGISDEEYARQLSSELNQRPSRGGRKPNGTSKKGASRTPKKVKKSREQIDDDSDEEADAGEGSSRKRKKTKATKKTGGGEAKGGFAKEFTLSEPLAAVLETPQLSRPQVVKRLWQYIKQHELQNPKNKKEILCDHALRAVFNSDKIDMFGMNKTLGQHLYEPDS